jgi:hypothetical protein
MATQRDPEKGESGGVQNERAQGANAPSSVPVLTIDIQAKGLIVHVMITGAHLFYLITAVGAIATLFRFLLR